MGLSGHLWRVKLMRKILFGLAAVTLVAAGSLAPAKAQMSGGVSMDHRGGGYGGDHDRKYRGDHDRNYRGNHDRKYGGDHDRNYRGDHDRKYGGDHDRKYGGNHDRKYSGGYDNGHQRYRPN
jgi:hypothetical protein